MAAQITWTNACFEADIAIRLDRNNQGVAPDFRFKQCAIG
jgi:hypothetical protein